MWECAAVFGSAPNPDELLLSCGSAFSIKERGLFGSSILIVEPGLIGTASRDGFSKVG